MVHVHNRRQFIGLGLATAGFGTGLLPAFADKRGRTKAVLFDAFVILDPRSVAEKAEALFPGKGTELSNAWRIRQFEYTWLRSITRRYLDFWKVTEEALQYAAKMVKLELDAEKRDRLMQAWLELKCHSDALAGLRSLKESGLTLAFCSNMTPKMLEANVKGAGLEGLIDPKFSTVPLRVYKPDPRAYQIAMDRLHLKRGEIVFAAFGGWDAAGAKAFGYRTFWVDRLGLPEEELGAKADGVGAGFADLVAFLAQPAP